MNIIRFFSVKKYLWKHMCFNYTLYSIMFFHYSVQTVCSIFQSYSLGQVWRTYFVS